MPAKSKSGFYSTKSIAHPTKILITIISIIKYESYIQQELFADIDDIYEQNIISLDNAWKYFLWHF
jgi:hypothetical protein